MPDKTKPLDVHLLFDIYQDCSHSDFIYLLICKTIHSISFQCLIGFSEQPTPFLVKEVSKKLVKISCNLQPSMHAAKVETRLALPWKRAFAVCCLPEKLFNKSNRNKREF